MATVPDKPTTKTRGFEERLYLALDSKRRSAGLSWRDLALKLHVDVSLFTRLGRGAKPSVDNFREMAQWLEVPMESFFTESPSLVLTRKPRKTA